MPVLNNISSRRPKPQDDTSAGPLIQCSSTHGDQSGGARINIGDTSTNLDAFRCTHKISHRSKKFIAPRLTEPDRVEAQLIGKLHFLDDLVPFTGEIGRVGDKADV